MDNLKSDRQFAPATQRNRQPILDILLQVLPTQGNILEIASGSGEHCVFFAPHFAPRLWLPSDSNLICRNSIKAWQEYSQINNSKPPENINVQENNWYVPFLEQNITSICCINMIHISPWNACLGLFKGAGIILPKGGILYLYGAYKRNGKHISHSNEAFDQFLQEQNSYWGVRNLEDVEKVGEKEGFSLREIIPMPSNNFSIIFQKLI
jgi:hypothetical protein